MTSTLIRLIEQGLALRGQDPAWIRRAMVGGGRFDLEGEIGTVDGPVFTDRTKAWPFDLLGPSTVQGQPKPAARVMMESGAAAGQSWPIVSAIGQTATVGADLEAAGVAPGDEYAIYRPEDDRAAAYLAETAVRVLGKMPNAQTALPCIAVIRTNANEQSTDVGRVRQLDGQGGPAGPVSKVLRSIWGEQYGFACIAPSAEGVEVLAKVVAQLYRDAAPYFDSVFNAPPRLQFSGFRPAPELAPQGAYVIELTLTGEREHFGFTDTPWLVDQAVAVAPNPR